VVNSQLSGQTAKVLGFSELKSQNVLEGPPGMKQKVIDNIRVALNQANVAAKSLSLAIPGDGSMTRYFELPILPKKDERSAVRFEAQKYVPFDMKDLYYDYETYPDAERKKCGVVFFACKKQWVDSLSSLLQLAGVRVSQVELVSQSLARAFYLQSPKGTGEVCAILAANNEQTAELVIQKNGSVLATQHLALSRTSLTSQLDIPVVVSDIRISMDYFNDNFKKLKLGRFYLAAPFPGDAQSLSQVLRSEFSVPVDSGKLFQPPTSFTSTAASAAAYGLTLSAQEKQGSRRIDLKGADATTTAPVAALSWEEEKKQLHNLAVTEILGLAVFFAVVYFAMSGITNAKKMELQKAMLKYPKAESAVISEPIETLQTKGMEAQKKIAFFSELIDRRVYFTSKMNALAKTVPANVQLQRLSLVDDVSDQGRSTFSIRLVGHVSAPQAGGELTTVNKLVSGLVESEEFMSGFDEIKIVSTQRTTIGTEPVMKFTLDCAAKKA